VSIPDLHLDFAFGTKAADANLHLEEVTLAEVAELLTTHREGPKDGRYFVPAKFSAPHRKGENITTWSGCCIDIDRDIDRAEIEDKLDGIAYVAHSTHTPGRARVFVPYNQPVPPAKHREVARALNARIGNVDPCNAKKMQFFYLPACAPGAPRWAFHTLDSAPLLHPLKPLPMRQTAPPAGNLGGLVDDLPDGRRYDDWLRVLMTGDNLHDNALRVTGSMVYRGMDKPTILAVFDALRDKLTAARGTDRVNALFAGELDRMVDGALHNRDQEQPDNAATLPDFDQFAITESAEEMEAAMAAQKFIWDRVAIDGQQIAIYGPPGVGKTLLTLNGISRQILAGEIDGSSVYYLNADDNARGIAEKQRLAERVGFRQLVPGRNGFEPKLLAPLLRQRIAQRRCAGCVVILDTGKKFVDLMDKSAQSDFYKITRAFVAAGGTVVIMAHVNKHKDADGQSVAAGTTDLIDDSDCAWILELHEVTPQRRTVLMRNKKARGDVDDERMVTYLNEGTYQQRFDSVTVVGEEDREAIEAQRRHTEKVDADQDYIAAIRAQINAGADLRTEIVKGAMREEGLQRRRLCQTLDRYAGKNPARHFWRVTHGEKNARHYSLLAPAMPWMKAADYDRAVAPAEGSPAGNWNSGNFGKFSAEALS
jgi:hypothetical protein